MSRPTITIELFGVPRARAGVRELRAPAETVSEALVEAIKQCPNLADVLRTDGSVAPQFLVSLDGRRFVTDVSQRLQDGDRLLLLSADAGG